MGASSMGFFNRGSGFGTRGSGFRIRNSAFFVGLLFLAFGLATSAQRGTGTPIWFEGARLIVGDGNTIENAAFLVEGETFTWVGRQGQRRPPQNATRVDLSGKTV